jgi:hypothetical protein
LHFGAAGESQKAKRHGQERNFGKYSHFALMAILALKDADRDTSLRAWCQLSFTQKATRKTKTDFEQKVAKEAKVRICLCVLLC